MIQAFSKILQNTPSPPDRKATKNIFTCVWKIVFSIAENAFLSPHTVFIWVEASLLHLLKRGKNFLSRIFLSLFLSPRFHCKRISVYFTPKQDRISGSSLFLFLGSGGKASDFVFLVNILISELRSRNTKEYNKTQEENRKFSLY